jgi:quercetin dioxygenase-like cupin family protein
MSPRIHKRSGETPTQVAILVMQLRQRGLDPLEWANPPGFRWGWHSHAEGKSVYCLAGGAIFHTFDGDVEIAPGDRLDIPAGARHAATVGTDGIACVEVSSPI